MLNIKLIFYSSHTLCGWHTNQGFKKNPWVHVKIHDVKKPRYLTSLWKYKFLFPHRDVSFDFIKAHAFVPASTAQSCTYIWDVPLGRRTWELKGGNHNKRTTPNLSLHFTLFNKSFFIKYFLPLTKELSDIFSFHSCLVLSCHRYGSIF